MFDLYPSIAIRVSQTPDPRLFGAGCLSTAEVAHIGELCTVIMHDLKAMADYKYNLRYFPGNKVNLTVGGLFITDPGPDADLAEQYNLFTDVVQQFNWLNPFNPAQKRFHLCSVNLLSVGASESMPDAGQVTRVNSRWCDCYRLQLPCSGAL